MSKKAIIILIAAIVLALGGFFAYQRVYRPFQPTGEQKGENRKVERQVLNRNIFQLNKIHIWQKEEQEWVNIKNHVLTKPRSD